MSEDSAKLAKMINMAAGIVVGSLNEVGIARAMEISGFSKEQRRNMTLYQRVRRRSMHLCIVEKKRLNGHPADVDVGGVPTITSSLTAGTPESEDGNQENNSRSNDSQSSGPGEVIAAAGAGNTSTNTPTNSSPTPRRNLFQPNLRDNSNGKEEGKKPRPKFRRSSKELQRFNAMKVEAAERHKRAMKVATKLVSESNKLPKNNVAKKSVAKIVNETNIRFNSNLATRTVSRYVQDGMVGTSPLKRGPIGDLNKVQYEALKGAYSTYLKLEQAASKKQSTRKQISKLVNATVNKGGFSKTRDDLTRKLQRDTANQFEVGKANIVEQRRVMWTTAYNLNVWYETWKELLVELGFGRLKTDTDKDVEGELVITDLQQRRICNMDETDGSIDDTSGQRGGRPSMTFFAPDVGGGATAVNKSGYSATIICGSNAAGEPIPLHFQLKSTAQEPGQQRLSVDWFANVKAIWARFGWPERKAMPCTFGMNEKAGMNSEELKKYMMKSILPLYPDIEDKPGKRVIMKVDSGPGRMNVEMLAELKLKGLYLVPGVPNTTGKTQEIDQNYGPFKSIFRRNIRVLSQARFEGVNNKNLKVVDLPMLVFGGTCPLTGEVLQDAFNDAFSMEMNRSCWKKCGAVPLTRLPLMTPGVRREVPVGDAALIDDGSDDPEIEKLKQIETLNHFYCDILASHGFDSSHLLLKAPTRTTYVAVTQCHSKDRVEAIKKAKNAGQMFFATGGRHLNSDEFFQAQESKRRDQMIKDMEKKKIERAAYCKEQKGAVLLLRAKGELTPETESTFTLQDLKVLLKWKKVKAKSAKKRDLVDAYIAAPKPKIQKIWCRSEEAELEALKADVKVEDTALGVASQQMARAVGNNLAKLDEDSLNLLRSAIESFEDSKNPNVL